MSSEIGAITRSTLLAYFRQAARPPDAWQVGMEVERLARDAATGRPLPYDAEQGPTIRRVLEFYRQHSPGDPILEGAHLVGLTGPDGSITLEPGGQVEWSSRPANTLDELDQDLQRHLAMCERIAGALDVRWVDRGVDPVHAVADMPWMPKARYKIMRPFLGARGTLAHRMMTQTAAIQCAFDYADDEDWRRKFLVAARLAPLATALFANSGEIDGGPSGFVSFRQHIWRHTDPARCGLPALVFDDDFNLEGWLDWVTQVPTIFRHRARGLVPSGGVPFVELMRLRGCDAIRPEDWETHVSTIFTEVRSYSYIEVRSADLQPPERMLAVPAFWTGLLYDDDACSAALELGRPFATHVAWSEGMAEAARRGGAGSIAGHDLAPLVREALELAREGLRRIQQQRGGVARGLVALDQLAPA